MQRMAICLSLLLVMVSFADAEIPFVSQCDTIRKSKGPNKGSYKIRCKYKEPVDIQGYPCIGWTWFYEDGLLDNFEVSETVTIQGIEIPKKSRVFLHRDGTVEQCYFSKDMIIQGYPCEGGHKKEATGFYPNGNLRFIFLTEPKTIQGIPCRHGGVSIIQFYENGRLKKCTLARDHEYKGSLYKSGTELYFDQTGNVVKKERPGLVTRVLFDLASAVVKLF